ncbi:crotonase/enoyl-CoA hydratase family protein [Caballeronia sp. LZ001]|uniref:crotonase/enoyl-CoA hydratase family protein n=1 Tax=Caballeronia sp. LZ001 TaxID=3038553 RepID=UPI0028631FD1|nr:crotonase/enoyl-CoA hydratase family protein [Caballeronia sp. LZ001]MDR5804875.1 crotonase/enoyl-CoA hydratase family protein [Caballeronia sp. LZ001]
MVESGRDPAGRIVVEENGHVLLIGVDRPEKRNGFTPKMFRELATAFTRLECDDNLRAGLVHAFGDHFSAGLDLPSVAEMRKRGELLIPPGEVDPFNLREPFRKKPVVAAFKGISFTLAVELMLSVDIAICAEDCRFAQLEAMRGIMPGCGATFRMVERAGWGNAMKLLLTGTEFGAAEAYRLNFAQEVVPAGTEFARALEWAQVISVQAPLAVRAILENARIAQTNGLTAALAHVESTQKVLYNSADAQEGVRAFVEKRPARYTGA